jgi:hypothetical protein
VLLCVDGKVILKLTLKIELEGVGWTHQAQERYQWWAFFNTVMNLWGLKHAENFLIPEELLAPLLGVSH